MPPPLRGELPNGRHHQPKGSLQPYAAGLSHFQGSHDDSTTDDAAISFHALARGHRHRRREQVHALCLGRCGQVPEARTIPRWQHCCMGLHRSGRMDECSGRRTQWFAGPSRMSLAVTMAVTALTASEIPIALQLLAGIIWEPSAHQIASRTGWKKAGNPAVGRVDRPSAFLAGPDCFVETRETVGAYLGALAPNRRFSCPSPCDSDKPASKRRSCWRPVLGGVSA